jgi:two-component system, sensor histidine kinase RegB
MDIGSSSPFPPLAISPDIALAPASMQSSAVINLRRLLGLRAITLAGLGLTLWLVVARLGLPLPLAPLAGVLSGMLLLTLATLWRLRRAWPVQDRELFGQLLLDVASLTALFYFSGGSTNPFVVLYLLPLAIAAAALPAPYVWGMAAVTTLSYTALLVWHVPLPHSAQAHDADFGLHVLGMWLGFVLSAALIAGFAVRMTATVRERDRMLAALRENALRHERVLALGTLATGAAHELGTPLSTMAVLVKDIEPERGVSAEKLAILRAQIARCKEILASLSAAAGQVRAESGQRLALDAWLRELVDRWSSLRPGISVRQHFDGTQPPPRIVAEQTLAQAITNILNNAADASPHSVEVDARWSADELVLEIADRGAGLAPELQANVGEPFLTTKSDGLGLGLFLAYTTLSRFGGAVRLTNRAGGGVCCRLTLPLAALTVSA